MTSKPQERQRRQCLSARRALDVDEHARASARIQRRFLRSPWFFSGKKIACYLAAHDEVDTSLIVDRCWRAGKEIYVPVIDNDERMRFVELRSDASLVRNRFGLWEPASGAEISAKSLDVVVTPVVAFDGDCNRIGMGGGYFDRAFYFLHAREAMSRPKLIGLGFQCQKVEKIRANPWDIRLYRVFSEAC